MRTVAPSTWLRHLVPADDCTSPLCGYWVGKADSQAISVIASDGMGWDHVSVAGKRAIPSYETMRQVKDFFFGPEEVVMELHVAKNDHISFHPHCLHLWRPQMLSIPLPPAWMVA